MTHYLGELGNLIPIQPRPIVDPLTVNHTRPSTINTTLGEVRVAQYGPRARAFRAWDVTIPDCTPDQLAPVLGFINGDYGVGPFWWLPEWAQQTNILPPSVTALDADSWRNAVAGGPVTLPDGTLAPTSLATDGATVSTPAVHQNEDGIATVYPALVGQPVTVAAWLSDRSQLVRLVWVDADGVGIGKNASKQAPAGGWNRVTLTETTPEGASGVVPQFLGSGRFTFPAVTWTVTSRYSSTGNGCQYAVVTGDVDEDVHIAMDDPYPWGQVASANLTITEVG